MARVTVQNTQTCHLPGYATGSESDYLSPRAYVMHRPSGSWRDGLGSLGCSPDKPMLLISSSHEQRTAIKPGPRAS